MRKVVVSLVLAAIGLIASPSLLVNGVGAKSFSTASAASTQTSQVPRLEVTLLANAGEADSGFDIATSQEFQLIESFLSGLPEVPPPNWNSLGWRGYQLLNNGVPNLPEQIRVFEGVIRTMAADQTHYFVDQHGFEGWLAVRAAQQGFTSGLDELTSVSQSALALDRVDEKAAVPVVAKDLPTSGSEPPYEPDKWNKPGVQDKNNCYNYARNKILDKFGRPGRGTTSEPPAPGDPGYNCANFVAAAKADGMSAVDCDKACPEGSYKVALVLDPDGSGGKLSPDYHWYRQDKGGKWSHKPGAGDVTDKDSSGKPITDPRTADRKRKTKDGWVAGYKDFCGCFCVKAS